MDPFTIALLSGAFNVGASLYGFGIQSVNSANEVASANYQKQKAAQTADLQSSLVATQQKNAYLSIADLYGQVSTNQETRGVFTGGAVPDLSTEVSKVTAQAGASYSQIAGAVNETNSRANDAIEQAGLNMQTASANLGLSILSSAASIALTPMASGKSLFDEVSKGAGNFFSSMLPKEPSTQGNFLAGYTPPDTGGGNNFLTAPKAFEPTIKEFRPLDRSGPPIQGGGSPNMTYQADSGIRLNDFMGSFGANQTGANKIEADFNKAVLAFNDQIDYLDAGNTGDSKYQNASYWQDFVGDKRFRSGRF